MRTTFYANIFIFMLTYLFLKSGSFVTYTLRFLKLTKDTLTILHQM